MGAFGYFRQGLFLPELERTANASFSFFLAYRWLGLRMDMICLVFTSGVVILAIGFKSIVNEKMISYTLQMSTEIIVFFSVTIRMWCELNNYMVCAQRIFSYEKIP